MYIVKNKMLQDRDGNVIKAVQDEIFLTDDLLSNVFEYQKYVNAVRSNLGLHVLKLYLLNDDETPLQDVSEYVLSGSVSYNYQQGQTHSMDLSVSNSDGFWSAEPINGTIWNGRKCRLDIGLYAMGTVYWRRCGIFVIKDVYFQGTPIQTASLQFYDKYALFDKKIGGNIDFDFKIPVGTNLQEAIDMCVHYEDTENGIVMYDTKPVYYEQDLSGVTTPYTITKSYNTGFGDIMVELADMVSNDIFYNETGNLTLRPGMDSFSYESRGIQWYYTEQDHLDYADPNYKIDYGAIINKITVKGGIVNGKQFKGVAINDNPLSKSNVQLNRINAEVIEDTNIIDDNLAKERAQYELSKKLVAYTSNSFKSIFIPHLMPKDVIMWTNPEFNIYNERFIIQSLSFQFGSGFFMDINMANMKEVGIGG